MNGHYHFEFKNGRTVNEKNLDDAIKQAKKVRSPIVEFGIVCTYGCGKLHPLTGEELVEIGKWFKKLPKARWEVCSGFPVVPALPESQKYSMTFHHGKSLSFDTIHQSAADKVGEEESLAGGLRTSVLLAAVTDRETGVFVRHFTGQEWELMNALVGHKLQVHQMGIGNGKVFLFLEKDGKLSYAVTSIWETSSSHINGANLRLAYVTNDRLEYCGSLSDAQFSLLSQCGVNITDTCREASNVLHSNHGFMIHRPGLSSTWHHSLDFYLVSLCSEGSSFEVRNLDPLSQPTMESYIVSWFTALSRQLNAPAPWVPPEGGEDSVVENAAQREPRLPALASHRYEARYLDGFYGSNVLSSSFVEKLKTRGGLKAFHVVNSGGHFVRNLSGEERLELIRLGYDVLGELKKGITFKLAEPPGALPVEVKAESLPPALVVKCPDGVNRTVNSQQLENLLVASVRMVNNLAAWGSFRRYGGVMSVGDPVENRGLQESLDDIYNDHVKKEG